MVNDSSDANLIQCEGITEKDLKSGNGNIAAEGKYHFLITDYTDKKEAGKTPHRLFNCTVLEAEYPTNEQKEQAGKVYHYRQYYERKERDVNGNPTGKIIAMEVGGGQIKGILNFALALGLFTIKDLETNSVNIDWAFAVGKQFMAEVRKKEKSYLGKKQTIFEVPFLGFYDITDPFVVSWPKNSEFIKLATGEEEMVEPVAVKDGCGVVDEPLPDNLLKRN